MTPHYTHSYDHMRVEMHMIRGVCGCWMDADSIWEPLQQYGINANGERENNTLILYDALNVISISIDFPADNTLHPAAFSANDKAIMISYHLRTVGNSPTQEETLIYSRNARLCG